MINDIKMSYRKLHKVVNNIKQTPNVCEHCNESKKLDLANISETYNEETYTEDIDNWIYLCRSCHCIYDKHNSGEKNPASKLKKKQVIEIREKYKKGNTRHRELGEEYGISRRHIGAIIAGDYWK